jgi:ketosteroid isomerase-like protein
VTSEESTNPEVAAAPEMSQENVESVLAAYARFNAGDKEPSLDDWQEDAEYVASSDDPDSDTHRGIEAIRQHTGRWVEAYPDLRVEPLETRSNGDNVFVWVRFIGHGAASGLPIDMELAHVCAVRNGKTARLVEYSDRREALKAAGLAE